MQTSVNDETREVVFLYKLVSGGDHARLQRPITDTHRSDRSMALRQNRTARTWPRWRVSPSTPSIRRPLSLSIADELAPILCRAIVERAIGISKQFEESSRARELAMRANETLPLTAQADAAFLLKLARLKLAGGEYSGDKAQLLRTLRTMRAGFSNLHELQPRAVAAEA